MRDYALPLVFSILGGYSHTVDYLQTEHDGEIFAKKFAVFYFLVIYGLTD